MADDLVLMAKAGNEIHRLECEIARLRGLLLVAHGIIMMATGGDENGKYSRDVNKIRAALGVDEQKSTT